MTTEIRTPFGSPADAIELSGGLYRKQVLRFGEINYVDRSGQSRKLKFDRKYGEDLIRAFKERAYEQVPFQLADAANRHTNDPTRTGGEVVGVELSADGSGVDTILRLWGQGQQVVENNPKLGVSARILENLTQPDGRSFPRALQHVLGTVDPQVSGMQPWVKLPSVELSNGSVSEVLDLSNATYERSANMPERDGGDKVTLELSTAVAEKLQTLTPERLDRLTEMLDEDEAMRELLDQLELDDLDDDPEDDDEDDDPDDSGIQLSHEDSEAIELANAQLASQGERIVELTNQLSMQRVEAELESYRAEGLAPAVLEAARPLLAVESGAVELSNGVGGESVDPGEAVREVLAAVIELSKTGHLIVDPDSEDGSLQGSTKDQSTREAMLADWENYG